MMGKIKKIILVTGSIIFLIFILLLLGTVVPILGGYQIKFVETGSMTPTIPVGSIVFVRATDEYRVNDIITFQRAKELSPTTHRIMASQLVEGEIRYVVQGDANNVADHTTVRPQEIIGRVGWWLPYVGYILHFFRQPLGFFLIVGLPAILVITEEVKKIRKEVMKSAENRKIAEKNGSEKKK